MEAAWRAGNWDADFQAEELSFECSRFGTQAQQSSLHTTLFRVLKCFCETAHDRDFRQSEVQAAMQSSRRSLVLELATSGPESIKNVTAAVASLQMLADVEKFWCAVTKERTSEAREPLFSEIHSLWALRLPHLIDQFTECEPVMALRGVMLQIMGHKELFALQLQLLVEASIQVFFSYLSFSVISFIFEGFSSLNFNYRQNCRQTPLQVSMWV